MSVIEQSQYSKITLLLALSRTPHSLLDMCTPLLAALLWLGRPPELQVILLGTIAVFAGYTAVYALNDIVDYRNDVKKIAQAEFHRDIGYLDAAYIRHPLAHRFLSMSEAVAWTGFWVTVSLSCAFVLNPVCALILVIGCILEILYCLLLQVSHLRTLVSGIVKTLGGLAAIFAVDASPDPTLLLLIFFWLFFGKSVVRMSRLTGMTSRRIITCRLKLFRFLSARKRQASLSCQLSLRALSLAECFSEWLRCTCPIHSI